MARDADGKLSWRSEVDGKPDAAQLAVHRKEVSDTLNLIAASEGIETSGAIPAIPKRRHKKKGEAAVFEIPDQSAKEAWAEGAEM